MNVRYTVVWAGLIALVILAGGVIWWWVEFERASDDSAVEPDKEVLVTAIDSLRDVISRQDSLLQMQPGLTEWDVRRLQRKGLEDPERQLVDSLLQHPELIRYEGVVGGTMAFRRPEVTVLSDRWIYAGFDDGHIAGKMLVEYSVSNHGSITWTVVDSYME